MSSICPRDTYEKIVGQRQGQLHIKARVITDRPNLKKKNFIIYKFKKIYDFLILSPPKNIKVIGFLINFATPIVPFKILKF